MEPNTSLHDIFSSFDAEERGLDRDPTHEEFVAMTTPQTIDEKYRPLNEAPMNQWPNTHYKPGMENTQTLTNKTIGGPPIWMNVPIARVELNPTVQEVMQKIDLATNIGVQNSKTIATQANIQAQAQRALLTHVNNGLLAAAPTRLVIILYAPLVVAVVYLFVRGL